jgi:hypothetical protein
MSPLFSEIPTHTHGQMSRNNDRELYLEGAPREENDVCKIVEKPNESMSGGDSIEKAVGAALDSQFTINSVHHGSFFQALKCIWDSMKIEFVQYSANCFKTNYKKKRSRSKKSKTENNREARLICLDENHDNLVYILDYEQYKKSITAILSTDNEWISNLNDVRDIPPTLASALTLYDLWDTLIPTVATYTLSKYHNKHLEGVLCISRYLSHRDSQSSRSPYDDQLSPAASDSGSLMDYMKDVKSLCLVEGSASVKLEDSYANVKRTSLHPYRLSACVFVLSEYYRLQEEQLRDFSTLEIYSALKFALADQGMNTTNEKLRCYCEAASVRIVSYVVEASNNIERSQEYQLWTEAMDLFDGIEDIIADKQASSVKVVCQRRAKLVNSILNTAIGRKSEPTRYAMTFDRAAVSPLDLKTSLSILKIRFSDLLLPTSDNNNSNKYDITFTSDRVTLEAPERFFATLIECVIPYMSTTPITVQRSAYPSVLYPLYATNILYGEDREVIYSLKAVLRLFDKDKEKGMIGSKYVPSDPYHVAFFRTTLPKILQRMFGGSRDKVLHYLTLPYSDPYQVWTSSKSYSNKKQASAAPYPTLTKELLQVHLEQYNNNNDSRDDGTILPLPLPSHYCTTPTPTCDKRKREDKIGGFVEGIANFYTMFKSICYMMDVHTVNSRCIDKLFGYFSDPENAVRLQSKYPKQFELIYSLNEGMDLKCDNVDISLSPKGKKKYEEDEHDLPHVLLYELCVSPDIPEELALELAMSIKSKVANKHPLNLSSPQPHYNHMHNVKCKLYDMLRNDYITGNSKEEYTSLYHTIQCIEELSFLGLDRSNAETYRGNKKTFENWLDFEKLDRSTMTNELPIQFNETTHQPVYSNQLMPIWPSEIAHSTMSTTRKYINNNVSTTDVPPFTGCHPDLLECIIVNTITEITQI